MGKRGNGEGSVYQRKDGRWVGQYAVQAGNGLKYRYIYGKARKAVAEKLTKAMADRDGGLVFEGGDVTVKAYLDRWLSDSVQGSVKPVTFDSYCALVRNHISPALGRNKLKTLTPAHLQGFHRSKLDSGLSPRSVQYMHTVLHRALKQALRWGLVSCNVSEAVDPPKMHREEIKPLTHKQARALLQVARETRDRLEALYVLAVQCGLRQGEILGLRWDDVDFQARTIQVRRTLTGVSQGTPAFSAPKTAKSRRNVRMSVRVAESLKEHRKHQLEERLKNAALWQDHGLVFSTQVGTPLNRHNLTQRSFRPLLELAGLPQIRFHDLRHTCATLLLLQGHHPKLVQDLLGHATVAITLDTYSHVLPGMGDGLADAMDEAFA